MDRGDAFKLIGSGSSEIRSVEGWRKFAAPKGGDRQWVDGRSAKELAKAWCASGLVEAPAEFLRMLRSHELTRELSLLEGYPEWKTDLRGELRGPRNHDLLLIGKSAERRVVVGV